MPNVSFFLCSSCAHVLSYTRKALFYTGCYCRASMGEAVQELEEEKQEVQEHLKVVQGTSSHVARHSKLLQERPALQQAVAQHSAACQKHESEAHTLRLLHSSSCVASTAQKNSLC